MILARNRRPETDESPTGEVASWPLLRRAFGYLRPYRLWIALYLLGWLVSIGFEACIPLAIRSVIDRGLVGGDLRILMLSVLAALGLYLGKTIFGFLYLYIYHFYEAAMARELRDSLFRRIQEYSYRTLDRADTGQLIARATSDVDALQNFLGHGLNWIVTSIGTYVVILLFAGRLSWELTLLSILTVPPLLWISLAYGRAVRPLYRQSQQAYGRVTGTLEEQVSGVRVVKAFARESEMKSRFDNAAGELLEFQNRLGWVSATRVPVMICIASLGTVLVIWVGGAMAIRSAISVGTLVAFNYYLAQIVGVTRRLSWVVAQVYRALVSAQRVFDILDAPTEVSDLPGAKPLANPAGRVSFENVSFAYEPGRTVLEEITFTAEPGEVVGIVGETGSGKSTLVSLIPRFYDVTGGCVRIDGEDVRGLTLDSLRRAIAVAPQEIFLFSESLRDNIAYGRPDADDDRVRDAAGIAQADRFIARMPEGYHTPVGDRGSRLSGGQRQRTSLARSLVPEPCILILDDTTSSIDMETERRIEESLRRAMDGKTTFLVSHRVSAVRRANRILVLSRGRIAESGDHDELIARGGIYARMAAVQSGVHPGDLRDDSPGGARVDFMNGSFDPPDEKMETAHA